MDQKNSGPSMLVYRILLVLALPVLAVRMVSAWLTGKEKVSDLSERIGLGVFPAGQNRVLWVHGASLGELTAAKSLIQDILNSDPDLHLLVSANTVSGRKLVSGWNEPRITARLAPLDNPLIVRRFLNCLNPIALLSMENEIWPMRAKFARSRNIPVIQVSGRMSEKTAAMWGRFARFSQRVIGTIDAVFPMDATAGDRFLALGLPKTNLMPTTNLKSAVLLAPPNSADIASFSEIYPRDLTILAGSTHGGEERLLLDSFKSAHAINPDLRLILAPRHEHRSGNISSLVKSTGLEFQTRSSGAVPNADTPIFLADTTGEMALWYSVAGTVLLGGSWVEKGGHSPFEPVQFGCSVVHGPDVSNHQQAYAALHDAHACEEFETAEDIAEYLGRDISGENRTERAASARDALDPLRKNSANTAPIISKISELTA